MNPQVIKISVSEYIFSVDTNPFAFDAQPKMPLKTIAREIGDAIENITKEGMLVRGIQSGKHDIARDDLVDNIVRNGTEVYSKASTIGLEIFASPYLGNKAVEAILAGFHEFKPKCEKRPQYPVDIWMVFDRSAYENIEYIHPHYGVTANDKWLVKKEGVLGLRGVIIVN